eukprot:snap_masked-scaffold_6-processed-gene-4.26-mRNA-1 protein AED:1.00 eAED:1.00 QI:0/-1/0/0/-1/1/1/0/257
MFGGLLGCEYIPSLSDVCSKHGYAFFQPILRSSYTQFGMKTLKDDVKDIIQLLELIETTRELDAIILSGHSTGCQIVCFLLQSICQREELFTKYSHKIKVAVLQAPVSDREGFKVDPEALKEAETRIQNSEKKTREFPIYLMFNQVPVKAERYISLFTKYGDDDFFSSDLTIDEIRNKMGHLNKFPNLRTIFCCSEKDEYTPKEVKIYPDLPEKWISVAENSKYFLLDGNHGLSNKEGSESFIRIISSELSKMQNSL